MSKFIQTRPRTNATVHRRDLLCMAPFAITAGLMPSRAALPRPSTHARSVRDLIALWDQEEASTSALSAWHTEQFGPSQETDRLRPGV